MSSSSGHANEATNPYSEPQSLRSSKQTFTKLSHEEVVQNVKRIQKSEIRTHVDLMRQLRSPPDRTRSRSHQKDECWQYSEWLSMTEVRKDRAKRAHENYLIVQRRNLKIMQKQLERKYNEIRHQQKKLFEEQWEVRFVRLPETEAAAAKAKEPASKSGHDFAKGQHKPYAEKYPISPHCQSPEYWSESRNKFVDLKEYLEEQASVACKIEDSPKPPVTRESHPRTAKSNRWRVTKTSSGRNITSEESPNHSEKPEKVLMRTLVGKYPFYRRRKLKSIAEDAEHAEQVRRVDEEENEEKTEVSRKRKRPNSAPETSDRPRKTNRVDTRKRKCETTEI